MHRGTSFPDAEALAENAAAGWPIVVIENLEIVVPLLGRNDAGLPSPAARATGGVLARALGRAARPGKRMRPHDARRTRRPAGRAAPVAEPRRGHAVRQ